MSERPTIRDVAARAGVTPGLVSDVLRDHPRARAAAATRERIRRAAAELGFRPNGVARSLRRARTGVLGLLLNDLRNPFYAELAAAVEQAAAGRGYGLVLASWGDEPEAFPRRLALLLERELDGAIVSSHNVFYHEATAAAVRTLTRDVPLVAFGGLDGVDGGGDADGGGGVDGADPGADPGAEDGDGHGERAAPPGAPGQAAVDAATGLRRLPDVRYDLRAAGRLATEHLLRLGRRRILFFGGGGRALSDPRHAGYRDALAAAALPVPPRSPLWLPPGETRAGALALALRGPDRPDGVVAFNDWAAFAVLSALRPAGIAVPEEVAVVGVDGVSLGALAAPPLTTVDLQPGAIGAACVERLLLDGASGAAGPLVLTPRLVVRASAPDPAQETPRATPVTPDAPHG